MIHPKTEVRFIDSEKGYGLFATAAIPKGTVTWARDCLDREFTPEQFDSLNAEIREVVLHYSYRNNKGNLVFCWDNARYMNHDNEPNTCITPYNVELALRDISKGEEVTNHYGMLNIIEPFTLPGPDGITVGPHDLLQYGPQWDTLLQAAFARLTEVEQPLQRFITQPCWQELHHISKGKKEMLSVTTCHYPG